LDDDDTSFFLCISLLYYIDEDHLVSNRSFCCADIVFYAFFVSVKDCVMPCRYIHQRWKEPLCVENGEINFCIRLWQL